MGLYNFKPEYAYNFASHIRANTRVKGNELEFAHCPYCNSTRDKYTFAINLKTGQHKCLRASCSVNGNMITLARDFDFELSRDVSEYYQHKTSYRKLKTPKEPIKPKKAAIEYLKSRGISEITIEKYEITCQNDNDNILAFPFYDEKGNLHFVKYRNINFNGSGNKEWCESNCKPILFGMKQCNLENKTLIITEGQIDSLSVADAGFENVVSVPTGKNGFTWIPHCWDWWSKFKELIVFGDCERGTITLLDDLKSRFPGTIKHIRIEDYKGCKDANEILQKYGRQAIVNAIQNSVMLPVNRVVKLSDVKKVDIYKLPKLKTGIHELDILLGGGLPYSQVDIIGGKRGDGKSTFASQIVCAALDQGVKTFVYSGELQSYLFKAWLDMQLASPRNVIENISSDGYETYFVTNSNTDKISKWYDDKIYIYDQSIIVDDEQEDLIKTIEKTIMQYGVKLILIDNLMTAIDLDASSKDTGYDKQGEFVKKLARMALKFDVLILLVAHRRKSVNGSDANDEIMGSSFITNLAGVVLSYDRDISLPQTQRKLIVSKSRLIGKLKLDGYVLHYDEKSKRIYGDKDDLYKAYGWEEMNDGFVNCEEMDLVFD